MKTPEKGPVGLESVLEEMPGLCLEKAAQNAGSEVRGQNPAPELPSRTQIPSRGQDLRYDSQLLTTVGELSSAQLEGASPQGGADLTPLGLGLCWCQRSS